MRKILVAFAVLGMFAVVANANDITFYFGAPQAVPDSAFVPDTPIGGTPTTVDTGGTATSVTMGLYANVGIDWSAGVGDIWNGIAMNFVPTGDVTIDGVTMDNYDHAPGLPVAKRWQADADLGQIIGDYGHMFLVGVDTFGLGGLLPAEVGGMPPDGWSWFEGDMGVPEGSSYYWLGNVSFTGTEGDVFMQVDMGGIARRGGDSSVDLVYFGLDGDAPMTGDSFMQMSATPEFSFVPEPASLILLSLVGLFLRRR